MNFGQALEYLKAGHKVAREGWNGKGMFLFLVPGSTFTVNRPPLLGIYPEGTEVQYHAHVDMKTATGEIVPWLCSQTDMLAEDWAATDGAVMEVKPLTITMLIQDETGDGVQLSVLPFPALEVPTPAMLLAEFIFKAVNEKMEAAHYEIQQAAKNLIMPEAAAIN